MQKAYVIVDAYSSGRMLPVAFREKLGSSPDIVLIHIQSTAKIMGKMAVPDQTKYDKNIIFTTIDDLVEELSDYEVVAVLAGQEPGVELADKLSERLNLPTSNGTKKSAARRDKYEMIKTIAEAGLAAPTFIKTHQLPDILAWMEGTNTPYPVVLKVLRSASTDGVYICSNLKELEKAFHSAIGHITIMDEVNTEVLVESFLQGKEYVVDAVSYDGQHYVTDVWEYRKKFIPGLGNIYDKEMLLSTESPEVQALIDYNSRMLDALDIKYGPSHAEIMLTPDKGPVLVEVGARLNGVVNPPLHNLCLGHDQMHLTVDCYADATQLLKTVREFPYKMSHHAMIVNLIHDDPAGIDAAPKIIEAIDEDILAQMRGLPSMVDMLVKLKPGQSLGPTRNLLDSPVRFFMGHQSPEQLEADYAKIQELKGRLFRLRPSADMLSVPGGVALDADAAKKPVLQPQADGSSVTCRL